MRKIPQMVSMEMEPKEAGEAVEATVQSAPLYPYGLSICLNNDVLDKLGVDISDWEVGDVFHLHAFARVTSISQNETTQGTMERVEMQIVALSGESEDEENEDEEKADQGFRPLG